MREDTADRFVGKIDVEFEEFITDSATTPKRIIELHIFDEDFRFMRNRRSSGRFFLVRKVPVFGEDMFPNVEDSFRRDQREERRRIL